MQTKRISRLIRSAVGPLIEAGAVKKSEIDEAMELLETGACKKQAPPTTCISRASTAKMLDISTRSLDRLAASGELKPRRVGRRRQVYLEADIVAYLNRELDLAAEADHAEEN
jgi:hypothetical protein